MTVEGLKAVKIAFIRRNQDECNTDFTANQALLAAGRCDLCISVPLARLDDINQPGISGNIRSQEILLSMVYRDKRVIAASKSQIRFM